MTAPARSLAYDALAEKFRGNASERIKQARATASHLELVLAAIDAGHIEATTTEVARLEGANLALRMVSETPRGGRPR